MRLFTGSSPHIRDNDTTDKIMIRVIIALIPAIVYSVILFGFKVIILYLTAILSCLLSSIVVKRLRKKTIYFDYPAVITALLLVMTLPPSSTVTMVIIGSVVAIVFAREVFGGLGSNVFNPALVGRAFLQAAFPANMSMYTAPVNVPFYSVFDSILEHLELVISGATASITATGAMTQSTPLTLVKHGGIEMSNLVSDHLYFESHYYLQLFLGSTAGAIGETSFLLILMGGIFLISTRTIDWRIPAGMAISLFVVSSLLFFPNHTRIASPLYNLLSGGFALGAFFMATDMVTCPSNPKGVWIYSFLIGTVLAILRTFGSSPEYMMYSILIGNMFMPLIVILTKPLSYGKKEFLNIKKAEANSVGGNK